MYKHIKLAIEALICFKGDNAARARLAFRNKSADEMKLQYGESGESCAKILGDYERHEKAVDEAIAWLKETK